MEGICALVSLTKVSRFLKKKKISLPFFGLLPNAGPTWMGFATQRPPRIGLPVGACPYPTLASRWTWRICHLKKKLVNNRYFWCFLFLSYLFFHLLLSTCGTAICCWAYVSKLTRGRRYRWPTTANCGTWQRSAWIDASRRRRGPTCRLKKTDWFVVLRPTVVGPK